MARSSDLFAWHGGGRRRPRSYPRRQNPFAPPDWRSWMARKNLLAGLTEDKTPNSSSAPPVSAPGPMLTNFAARGAPGSISRSIGDLAAKATVAKELEAKLTAGQLVAELDADLVDPSFIADRMTVS